MRKRLSFKTCLTRYGLVLVIAVLALCTTALLWAQPQGERFGIGTFTYQGRTFTGLVLRLPNEVFANPAFVVELAPAAAAAKVSGVPKDVLGIIDEWDNGANAKIHAVVKFAAGKLDAKNRPSWVIDYASVKAEKPFTAREALYAFSNYPNVSGPDDPNKAEVKAKIEAKKDPGVVAGLWDRPPDNPDWVKDGKDSRPQNPFAFLEATYGKVFAGDHDPIIIYHDRPQVEYECELGTVTGKDAYRVPPDKMEGYIFGYENGNDVSDREHRDDIQGKGDYVIEKGHDGYKPIGPFIVPKEFVDPKNEAMKFVLTDAQGVEHPLQDHNTSFAYHSVYDFLSFYSNSQTLPAGTIFSLGTPPGSHGGLHRFMLDGDVCRCSYQGLGTLTNPVVKEKE